MSSSNESLGETVRRRLEQHGLARGAAAAEICRIANTVSEGRFEAIRFQRGTLTLRATSAIALDELRFTTFQLEKQLRELLRWPSDRPFKIKITL